LFKEGFISNKFFLHHRYLTNDGIEHLQTYLNLPSEIVPATLKKSAHPPSIPMGALGLDWPPQGPPREGGEKP
jgi:small subunit ribosomal protein S10e